MIFNSNFNHDWSWEEKKEKTRIMWIKTKRIIISAHLNWKLLLSLLQLAHFFMVTDNDYGKLFPFPLFHFMIIVLHAMVSNLPFILCGRSSHVISPDRFVWPTTNWMLIVCSTLTAAHTKSNNKMTKNAKKRRLGRQMRRIEVRK